MNKESVYSPYEEVPLIPGIDPKYKKYRRFVKASFVLSCLAFVFSSANFHYHRTVSTTAPAPPDAIMSVNEPNAQIYATQRCYGEWDVSKQQVYTLPDDYTGLVIGARIHHSVSGQKTDAVIVINPELERPKVTFDLHFSDLDDDADTDKYVHIDVDNDKRSGTQRLTVVVDDDKSSPGRSLCFNYDVTVEVPTADALRRLVLGVPNSAITVKDVLIVQELLKLADVSGDIVFSKDGVTAGILTLETASGDIQVGDAIVSGKAGLSTASGNIHASVHTLGGDLAASSTSGTVAVVIDTIKEGKQDVHLSSTSGPVALTVHEIEKGHKSFRASAVSGNIDAILPETFTSTFKLSALKGHMTVDADHPENIHYDRKNGYNVRGSYGTPLTDAGEVSLAAVSGNIGLKYTSQ